MQLKIQRRANNEKYEIKFTHIINKRAGGGIGNEELNQTVEL